MAGRCGQWSLNVGLEAGVTVSALGSTFDLKGWRSNKRFGSRIFEADIRSERIGSFSSGRTSLNQKQIEGAN